ncbi:MAG: hypothetical protein AAFR47_16790 [Pseudomonadota bacterium]
MRPALICLLAAWPLSAVADPAEIVASDARAAGATWTVSVTLRHADTGWDDYADGWRLVTPEGTVIATRELLHPHVDEQPFTRSLSGVSLPQDVQVLVESSTNVTGWSGERVPLALDPQ